MKKSEWSAKFSFTGHQDNLIFKSLVQSGMLCGAETCTLGRHQANKLLASGMVFRRRSASKKSRKKKITNLKIREIMNAQYIIILAVG